jgi:hypothetical protein
MTRKKAPQLLGWFWRRPVAPGDLPVMPPSGVLSAGPYATLDDAIADLGFEEVVEGLTSVDEILKACAAAGTTVRYRYGTPEGVFPAYLRKHWPPQRGR